MDKVSFSFIMLIIVTIMGFFGCYSTMQWENQPIQILEIPMESYQEEKNHENSLVGKEFTEKEKGLIQELQECTISQYYLP